jgi:hypothetical protein
MCDQETSKMSRLKPATGLWKIQPQWVVTPGKQTKKISDTNDETEETKTRILAASKATSSLQTVFTSKYIH